MKSIQLILCFMPGIEGILKTLGIEPSVLVDDVRVHIRHHLQLGVSRITLYGFHISAVKFEFVGNAAVPQTMKYYLRKPVNLLNISFVMLSVCSAKS